MKVLPIICITGTDGAGKSVITDDLVKILTEQGITVVKVWSRFNNYTSKPLLALTRLTGHNHSIQLDNGRIGFHDFETLGPFRYLFAGLQLIDLTLASHYRIYRKKREDNIVLCERGPWDTLVDVITDTGLTGMQSNWLGRQYVRHISEHSITYLISREVNKIVRCRPELAQDYKMEKRFRLYHDLAGRYNWLVVDNNGDLQQAKQVILDDLIARGILN